MWRVLAAAGVLAVVVAGVVAGSRFLGPGTQAAPESRLYVAISRSDDETAAREIEVIDTASGERSLIDVGARISALALSADRRTLYVGLDDGRLLLVDPTSGVTFGEIRTRRASWILPRPGSEVILVGPTVAGGAIAKVDVAARREIAVAELDAQPGQPAIRGDELLVPLVVRNENHLAVYSVARLEIVRPASLVTRITGRTALGVPLALLMPDGRVAYLAQWDSGQAGARLFAGVAAEARPAETLIALAFPARPVRSPATEQSSLAAGPNGALHVCVGNAELAARYVVTGAARAVGRECGQLARVASRMYLAVRGKPRVAVIDATSGEVLRELLLPGIPVLVAASAP